MLFFFPRDVLDEIWNLIESVSEGFPSYFYIVCYRIRQEKNLKNHLSFRGKTLLMNSRTLIYLEMSELFPLNGWLVYSFALAFQSNIKLYPKRGIKKRWKGKERSRMEET